MLNRRTVLLVALGLFLSACASGSTGEGPGGGRGTAPSLPALQLAVLDAVGGHLDFCDPDTYPVARGTPVENARKRLPEIKGQPQVYRAILAHQHIGDDADLTDAQLVAVDEDFKQMQVVHLQPAGDRYGFVVVIPAQPPDAGLPTEVRGTVGRAGDVKIDARLPGRRPMCPVCLAAGSSIDTPEGAVAVQEIRVGMRVWTMDDRGRRVGGVVRAVGHTPAPVGHRVVRLVLADGRTVSVSPGHPTSDGRPVGSLRPGAPFAGSTVVSAERVPYAGRATWDLLPSGPTGIYWANGIPLGSTLYGAGTPDAGHTPAVSMA